MKKRKREKTAGKHRLKKGQKPVSLPRIFLQCGVFFTSNLKKKESWNAQGCLFPGVSGDEKMSLVAELVKFCSRDFGEEEREAAKKPVILGPWGGNGGHKWSFNEEGKGYIKQILIVHGDAIDSITFTVEIDGKTFSKKVGGRGGSVRKTVDIDVPGEYLTNIGGFLRPPVVSTPVLNAIKFVTNLREYGPYGTQDGSYFTLPVQEGMIVGFHGRAGDIIDSIGVYMKPG